MSSELAYSLEKKWLEDLPHARPLYPRSVLARVKYLFWRYYTPYHPFVRDAALALRIVRHVGRQDYLIGMVAPHLSVEKFVSNLIACGYGNHFVAWKDEGELVSLRYVENFEYQYHLRVFRDREVRAHYEHTPECYPISHMKQKNMEARKEEFLKLLGSTIVAHVPGKER